MEKIARRAWVIFKRCFKRMRIYCVRVNVLRGETTAYPVKKAMFPIGQITIIQGDDTRLVEELLAYVEAVDRDHAIERIFPRVYDTLQSVC